MHTSFVVLQREQGGVLHLLYHSHHMSHLNQDLFVHSSPPSLQREQGGVVPPAVPCAGDHPRLQASAQHDHSMHSMTTACTARPQHAWHGIRHHCGGHPTLPSRLAAVSSTPAWCPDYLTYWQVPCPSRAKMRAGTGCSPCCACCAPPRPPMTWRALPRRCRCDRWLLLGLQLPCLDQG